MSAEVAASRGTTASPRRQRQGSLAPLSPTSDTSNPPEELLEAYKRIEEDGTLADFVPAEDGWDAQLDARPASRTSRSSSRARRYTGGGTRDELTFSDASFLDDTGEHLHRRKVTDHTKDEQRLRRVTGTDSPVFSRARTGARAALTADNLQRREDEEEHHVEEDDGDRGQALNVPSSWGSRAGRRRDWLRNVRRRSESEPHEEKEASGSISMPQTQPADDTVPKPKRVSPRAVERSSLPTRSALVDRTANMHAQGAQDDAEKNLSSDQNAPPNDGNPIPNTPIVVYKSPAFTKPSATKRDSRELLRRLSRTESPKEDQVTTPEPPKLFGGRIYDKTPRVTGAWIDTPMTERRTELPGHLTKDIVPSSVAPKDSDEHTSPSGKVQSQPDETKPDPNTQESQPAKPSRALIRPKLPKSALQTVMEDVTSGKEPLDIGDDTIESLQAILDDPTELKTEDEDEAEYEKVVLKKLQQASSEGKDADIDRLNEKLQSLMKNINDVKLGLDGLENQVSRDAAALSRPNSSWKEHLHMDPECEACGMHRDGRVYAAIPLPRLWTRNDISRRIQLTKLGWITFVSLTWYVTECVMCEQYCHPVVSDSCEGYCLQPDAPHFPWVTVTMLWRWSHLSTLLAPILTVSVAIFRLVAQLFGLWDGFVDEPPQLANIVGEIRINGTPVSFPWLSPPPAQSLASQPQPPVWTPHNVPPSRWDDDQESIDDDEYL